MFKKMTTFALTCALTLSLAACGGGGNGGNGGSGGNGGNTGSANGNGAASPAPSDSSPAASPAGGIDRSAKIKIRMITHYTDDARRKLLNDAIAKFKTMWPNADVEDETTTEYGSKMKLEFTSGDGPDFVTVDDQMQQTLLKGNYLADITDIVQAGGYADKSVPGSLDFQNKRTAGKYYSVPFLMAPVVFYYNKDVFSALGVTPPATLEEFEAILDKAKAAGYQPIADPGNVNFPVIWLVQQLIFKNAPMEDVQKWYYGTDKPDSVKNAFVQALTTVDDWSKKGYFGNPKIAMGVSYDNYVGNLFAGGKVAMAMDGDWNIAAFQNSGVNTGIFAFPTDYIVNSPDSGWALSAKADDTKRAAFADWLNIFYDKATVSSYYEAGYTPSVNFDTAGLQVTPLKQELQSAVADKKMGYFLDSAVSGLTDTFTKTTQDMMLGKSTPEKSWEAIDQAYDSGKAK